MRVEEFVEKWLMYLDQETREQMRKDLQEIWDEALSRGWSQGPIREDMGR